MTPQERHQRIKELFTFAMGVPPPEREAHLRGACADADLVGEVQQLLRDADTPLWLGKPDAIDPFSFRQAAQAAADGSLGAPGMGMVGSRIGRYLITRVIAEGGMGVVYEAKQEEPARKVALKIIRAGVVSGAAMRRFEYESRVLAVLSHPGIAQVYEAGRDTAGLPFFAMEYIEGARNLIEYADAQHLGGSERLSLLGQVCDAVHHGHQKGVIHRDLKPANILVDTRSGMAQPKVIDFGVARATDSDLTVATLDTGVGQIIGTLRYMSPEQCDGDPRSVDIRSDVYALGVIAYELLTGTMPYDLSELSLASVARAIRELPAKPLSAISASLRGDTETLVLKALEKEPARRYQSAADMAADIRRLRAHEPLMARPASSVYLAKKFVRRHRTGVSAAAGVVAALVLGIVGFAVQAHRVAEQRDRAVKAGKRSDAVATFIRTTLQTSDPNRGGNQGMLVADSMMNAVAKLDAGEFKDEPEIDSSLRLTIAEILSGNGRLDEALALADRALGSIRKANPGDHRDVAKGLRITGGCLVSAGRFEAALPKLQEALEMDRRLSKDDHTDIATDLNDIGLCLESLGRHSEALPMLQAALEMNQRLHPGDHDDVSVNMNNMGLVLNSLGRREEALAQFQAALDMRQRLIKVDHPMIATGLANVGATLNLLGKPAEALPRLQGALEMSQRLYKGDHPTTANNMRHLALCLSKLDRLPEALDMAQQGAAMASRALPDGHPIRAACDRAVTNIKKKIDERSGTKTPKPGG